MGDSTKRTPRRKAPTSSKEAQAIKDLIRAHPDIPNNYDPVVAMAIIGSSNRTPLNLQVKCHTEVAKYIHPQLKAIEHSGDAPGLKAPELTLTINHAKD